MLGCSQSRDTPLLRVAVHLIASALLFSRASTIPQSASRRALRRKTKKTNEGWNLCRKDWAWRTSSKSESAQCVEVSCRDGKIYLRDSKDPDGAILDIDVARWPDIVSFFVSL